MRERRVWKAAFRHLRHLHASRLTARNFVLLYGSDNLAIPTEVWRRQCGPAWWDRNVCP